MLYDDATSELIPDGTRYVQQLLVTDTVVYEIVHRTAQTIRLRAMSNGDRRTRDTLVDGGTSPDLPPVIWTEQVSNPEGNLYTVRRRKDGTYRMTPRGNPLTPAAMIQDEDDIYPARRTDYRW